MLRIDSSDTHTYREIFQQPEIWRKTYNRILDKKGEISSFLSTYYSDESTIIFTGAGTTSFIGNILTFMLPKYNIYNFSDYNYIHFEIFFKKKEMF